MRLKSRMHTLIAGERCMRLSVHQAERCEEFPGVVAEDILLDPVLAGGSRTTL